MDSSITAAGSALRAGDPLGALKRVALRDDAPALEDQRTRRASMISLVRDIVASMAYGEDALLGRVDEDAPDPARLQCPVNGQLPQHSGAWLLGVVDPAERHRQSRRRADGEIIHLAAPGALP